MRKQVLSAAMVAALSCALAAQAVTSSEASTSSDGTHDPTYLNNSYSAEERAADLVSRMTLEEKASQMNSSRAAAIPRLGVAAYGWWNEAAHGVAREQTTDNSNPPILTNTTSYPVSLSLGSTWNPSLMYQEASLIGDEARDVVQGNQRDLDFYSPTVNLARDPRWGRNDETFSEDPFLTTAIASPFVNGMEGKDENGKPLRSGKGYLKTLTTLKHFAANNSEFNRRTGSSDMDDRTLREYYTAQFRGIIQQSDPGSIMSSYNRVNGTPTAADVYLTDTLARKTFGFGGYFTSDCDAIYEIQAGHKWQPPGYPHPLDEIERHAFANSAGEDLDCNQGYHDKFNYANTLPTAVKRAITTQTGLYTENDVDVSVVRLFTARIRLGEFDDESKVPWVQQARQRLAPGTWTNSDANRAVTQTPERLAMARKAADQSLVLLKNEAVQTPGKRTSPLLPLRVPKHGAYKIAVVGPYANPDSMYLGGYSSNQGAAGKANQVNGYQGIKAAVHAIDPEATVDFLPGLSADHSTVVAADVAATKDYDAVVVYAGTDNKTADEDTDRTSLALPGAQSQLIEQVADANPRTVAYLETMGQVDVRSFEPKVSALLWSSYNGQRKGEGLADVLLGRHNPSGHLPFTWYRSVDQLPSIADYGIRPTSTTQGRTYQYFAGPVSYPFGHGLGYSAFRYSGVSVDRSSVDANGRVTVTARATNTGRVAGTDVVQLYAATPDSKASQERPIKRLAGFERVTLKPGRSTTVQMSVKMADLAFYDESRSRYTVDQGRYDLQLASSAAKSDVLGLATTRVRGSLEPVPSVVTANPRTTSDVAKDIPRRVFYATGDVIDPQLTVTLSDDQIFGYVTKGKSTVLPAGMTVSYRSNRPQVVDVSGRGEVKATGSGAATVTATVRYHGSTERGTFVVDVR
ncbi:glycoside hydrolase family 3 C-terminal domain-containing protein [Aeromicrobium sp.]|uniref:glycoside hydrolase family 3 C-terminal domain-containing protein n=1 Tax=Aeromicrobium sp. TaxID=1871063 RepID=UPI0025C0F69B|nr:glycoside hydrolase family 3 C-terminal domain-containing protein [Aeromicrobium sp.]